MDGLDLTCCDIVCWLVLHELGTEDDTEPFNAGIYTQRVTGGEVPVSAQNERMELPHERSFRLHPQSPEGTTAV